MKTEQLLKSDFSSCSTSQPKLLSFLMIEWRSCLAHFVEGLNKKKNKLSFYKLVLGIHGEYL